MSSNSEFTAALAADPAAGVNQKPNGPRPQYSSSQAEQYAAARDRALADRNFSGAAMFHDLATQAELWNAVTQLAYMISRRTGQQAPVPPQGAPINASIGAIYLLTALMDQKGGGQ